MGAAEWPASGRQVAIPMFRGRRFNAMCQWSVVSGQLGATR
jgi:hypothetical protein